jgi:tRNA threonylcarbamoyladenosine biosynthesis protein TsaB
MTTLYIDSSDQLTIGVLSENFEWKDFSVYTSKKTASLIHAHIFEMLKKIDLKIKDIDRVIFAAGPGSYTGMRLSFGSTSIFEWQGIKINSFYHFEVPKLLGEEMGYWVSWAFKGEYFQYEWNGEENSYSLKDKSEFSKIPQNSLEAYYTNFNKSFFNGLKSVDDISFKETSRMIYSNAPKLFSTIVDLDLKRDPYYYRPLEKEFKASFFS